MATMNLAAQVLGTLLLAASTAGVLASTNSPPEISRIRMTDKAAEGQSVSLTGAINDPDAGDGHVVLIYWYGGDGEENQQRKEKLRLPPGQSVFQASHLYTDDLQPTKVKVVVFDHELPFGANDNTTGGMMWDAEFLPLEVRNAAPSFVEGSVTVQKPGGRKVVVEGKLADASNEDTIMVEAKWGQGQGNAPTTCTMSEGDRRFRCEHTYTGIWGVPQTYHIGLRAIDDDGGLATHQTSVRLP